MNVLRLIVLRLAVTAAAVAQQPDTPLYRIEDPSTNPQKGIGQGYSVAVDGRWTVAGCPYDDFGGLNGGAVKVYHTATGALAFTLLSPIAKEWSNFGSAVAVKDDIVVVGSPQDVGDDRVTIVGAVYVYDLRREDASKPILVIYNPNKTGTEAYDLFGYSVATNGRHVAVGTPSSGRGRVFVFDLSSPNPLLPLHNISITNNASQIRFGHSVAMDLTRLAVGAKGLDLAHVYDLASSTPTTPIAVLSDPVKQNVDRFGLSIAISGSKVLVGAPEARIGNSIRGAAFFYDLESATPTTPLHRIDPPAADSSAEYGSSVSISGSRFAVAAPGQSFPSGGSRPGAAYVYSAQAGAPPSLLLYLTDPNPQINPGFGNSVAINHERVIVGAPADASASTGAGAAYGYDLNSSEASTPVAVYDHPSPENNHYFGYGLAAVGNFLAVGTPGDDEAFNNSGSVNLFDLDSTFPPAVAHRLVRSSGDPYGFFGNALASSGNRIVVRSNDSTGSRLALYDLSSPSFPNPVRYVSRSADSLYSMYGNTLAFSGDRVASGSPLKSGGSVFVFDVTKPLTAEFAFTIQNPSGIFGDMFGSALALEGKFLAVGAINDSNFGVRAGSVHLYDLDRPYKTTPVAALGPNPVATQARFGSSLAIKGSWLFVGATYSFASPPTVARVEIYNLEQPQPSTPIAVIQSPSGKPGDDFGSALAVNSNRLIVGAARDSAAARNSGSIYTYDISTPSAPVLLSELKHPRAVANANLGTSLALVGERFASGAPYESGEQEYRGAVYVFGEDALNTRAPILTSPASGTVTGKPVSISFTLPEAAMPGSLKLSFGSTALTLASSLEAAGTHQFSLEPADPTSSSQVVAGDPVQDGLYDVRITYQDAAGNAAAADESKHVTLDTVTTTPTLLAPVAASSHARQVRLAYHLPETALPNSVRVSFGPHQLVLAPRHETAGTHDFIFDSKAPSSSPDIASGAPIPDGSYLVTLSYQDTVGNAAAESSSSSVVLDTTGPSGGTMSLSPSSSLAPSTPMTVTFSGWSDPHSPLLYELLLDDVVVSPPAESAARLLTTPDMKGVFFIKGRIHDSLGNTTTVTAAFDTGTTPQEEFDKALAATSLSGPDALAEAVPFADGVANLLKYAFNLNLEVPDRRGLVAGSGLAGLPVVTVPSPGVMRIEYLRRVGSGLIYTPLKCSSLDHGPWSPITAQPVVTPINASWQRVHHDEPLHPTTRGGTYARVEVTLP